MRIVAGNVAAEDFGGRSAKFALKVTPPVAVVAADPRRRFPLVLLAFAVHGVAPVAEPSALVPGGREEGGGRGQGRRGSRAPPSRSADANRRGGLGFQEETGQPTGKRGRDRTEPRRLARKSRAAARTRGRRGARTGCRRRCTAWSPHRRRRGSTPSSTWGYPAVVEWGRESTSGWFRRASPRVGEERNPREQVQSHLGEASFEDAAGADEGREARGARGGGGDAPCECTPRWRTSCPCSRAGDASREGRVDAKEARAREWKCEPHVHLALVAGRVPTGGEGLAEGQPGPPDTLQISASPKPKTTTCQRGDPKNSTSNVATR